MHSIVLALAAIIAACVTDSNGECCNGKSLALCKPDGKQGTASTRLCGDCSIGTPYCAHGKCNVFGCACKGGCRNGGCSGNGCGRGRRSVDFTSLLTQSSSRTSRTAVAEIDQDDDERISLEEAQSSLQFLQSNRTLVRAFEQLDRDHNGFLTAEEIDSL